MIQVTELARFSALIQKWMKEEACPRDFLMATYSSQKRLVEEVVFTENDVTLNRHVIFRHGGYGTSTTSRTWAQVTDMLRTKGHIE